ncbi:MAG TPA: nickel-dependent lactate racemase [Anaerolineae bacterium]|nr:nickel-dependent lactate racemase [Anaerolineae bacterium]
MPGVKMGSLNLILPYGRRNVTVSLPEGTSVQVLEPRIPVHPSYENDATALITRAVTHPLGTPPLRDIVQPGQRVVIITSDTTRPCPTNILLPPVLEELREAGCDIGDVRLIFAVGAHRHHTRAEQAALIGKSLFGEIECIDSDPEDVIFLGTTRRGTPVEAFRPVVEADVRICLGVVEFHYFAGYSGGAKALVPGVCSQRTIQANHAMMLEPGARSGRLVGNPVREDLEEAAAMIGANFILNVVLGPTKSVIFASAGDVTEAHRAACAYLDERYKVRLESEFDIVVVSAGGWPKDINLYQSQKALDNAAIAVRPESIIILVAECKEGLGHPVFEEWLTAGQTPDELMERIRENFVLGGHKAAAIAAVLKGASVYLVSALSPELVRQCGFVPFATVQEALETALARVGSGARLLVMPYGDLILPTTPSQRPALLTSD